MKLNYIYIVVLLAFSLTSCSKYLDKMPDSRAEIDTEEEVGKLLVSAYPEHHSELFCELSSDNVDDYLGSENKNSSPFSEEVALWKDITISDNESPMQIWQDHYKAIAAANQALKSIEEMGNTSKLQPYKGEALLARAFSHFMLVNIFCQHYNPATASKDLGIPYMSDVETELSPKYGRGNVADVYKQIEKDIEEGLPLINESVYTVPKYHFNKKAAYAFASRFYLFYQKWEKVIENANKVFGSDPALMLRDWNALNNITREPDIWAKEYVKDSHKSNLLICTGYSRAGLVFGPYRSWKRFCVQKAVTSKEITTATAPWGKYSSKLAIAGLYSYYANMMFSYTMGCEITAKVPYLFEYTDPVAQIGFNRSVFTLIQTEEALFNRAEAYVMLKQYDNAVADMQAWKKSRISGGVDLTRSVINDFYNNTAYFEPLNPTIKKKLNPNFAIESGEQENMLHCILQMRRLHFIHEGMRWFDIKRFGIEVDRRLINSQEKIASVTATLGVKDLRRAIQIPQDVISAGLEANPR